MKITEEDVKGIMSLLMEGQKNIELAKSLSNTARPLLKEAVVILSENIAEFKPMIEKLSAFTVVNRINSINLYEENGFTRQEAILLSMHDSVSLKEALNNYNKSAKK